MVACVSIPSPCSGKSVRLLSLGLTGKQRVRWRWRYVVVYDRFLRPPAFEAIPPDRVEAATDTADGRICTSMGAD